VGGLDLNVTNYVEKNADEMADMIGQGLVSLVVFGEDINKDTAKASECNLLVVVGTIDLATYTKVNDSLSVLGQINFKYPLIMAEDEIEGMMDSVPETFLQIMMSYQTVYGRSVFRGLSSLNQEYLRSQTEKSIRENLFCSRIILFKGISEDGNVMEAVDGIRDMLMRSIKIYHILAKPWIKDDEEHLTSFYEEFPERASDNRRLFEDGLEKLDDQQIRSILFNAISRGIKPILKRVDEMGP
jgi:hypothetical protein